LNAAFGGSVIQISSAAKAAPNHRAAFALRRSGLGGDPPSRSGNGENGFLDFCQSEMPDRVQIVIRGRPSRYRYNTDRRRSIAWPG
jgi:hypothetical protein